MNRVLRRPMFRIGGSAEGLTSGLAPRQGYEFGKDVQQVTQQRDLINALAPRKDTGLRDFLINFGLDIASRPPQGSIFSTAAASAKGPFEQYQAKKFHAEQSDRDLVTQLVKGLSDEELSRAKKLANDMIAAGMTNEAGEKMTYQEALATAAGSIVYGVMPAPGEKRAETVAARAADIQARDDDIAIDSAMEIAEKAQRIFDGKVEGVTKEDIDTDQLFIESDTFDYLDEDPDTGIYTVKVDASPGDQSDFEEMYEDGMVYYNYKQGKKMFYRRSGKQFIPVDQPE